MILIVDLDEARCATIFSMVNWTDNRLKILTAKSPAEVWALIKLKKPRMLICGDSIPDIQSFRENARKAMPATMLVLCSNPGSVPADGFDERIDSPPTRIGVLSCMHALKKRRGKIKENGQLVKRNKHLSIASDMSVMVGMDEEAGLTFKVPAKQGMKITDLIQHLGKPTIKCRKLLRDGEDVGVRSDTPLQDGDLLYFY